MRRAQCWNLPLVPEGMLQLFCNATVLAKFLLVLLIYDWKYLMCRNPVFLLHEFVISWIISMVDSLTTFICFLIILLLSTSISFKYCFVSSFLRNIEYYPSSCDRVLMIDASENMISKARKKISELSSDHTKFACRIGNSSDLSEFPDQCFDTVVDTFGLCSYDDPVAVLKEMNRVCKPDGRILLLEHGRSKTWSFITKYLDNNAERHAKNWGCVWNRDLDKIIESSGLVIDTLHTWHFATTYYVVCHPNHTI